jgi:hypothetical protein
MDAKGIFYVDDYTTYADFVHDDTPAFTAALAAANAAGGGTVYINPKHYWIKTANITISQGVKIECSSYGGMSRVGLNYTNIPCSLYITSPYGVILGGEINRVNVFRDTVHTQNPNFPTRASMQSFISSFSGVGIQIGDGTNGQLYNNAVINQVAIGGFATCININYSHQNTISDVLGDCTNGMDISNSFDNNHLRNIEFWQFLTTNKTPTFNSWAITSLSDNGVGLWRATLASTSGINTGESLWVMPVPGSGGEGASGLYTVTVIDGANLDLQGSSVAPTTTGTTVINSTYITVASTANLQPGMNVSGAGIPVGATIAAVWRSRAAISLDQSHAATASAAGVALTFSSNAYVSGSILSYDGTFRDGYGFRVGRADGTTCEGCFVFGFREGFNFNGAIGNSWTNTQYDTIQHTSNQNKIPIGIEFTGTNTYGNYISGPMITSSSIGVMTDATNGAGTINNVVDGFRVGGGNQLATEIEVSKGGLTATNFVTGAAHSILIDATTQQPILNGNAASATKLYGTGIKASWSGSGNIFGGNLPDQNPSKIGASQFQATGTTPLGNPTIDFYDQSQVVDGKYWRFITANGTFYGQTVNDAYGAASTWITVARTGNSPTLTTISTPLTTKASSTTAAGLNIPHGTAPTTPNNGDIWTTTANLFARINGSTQTILPLSSSLNPTFGSSVRINAASGSYQWYASGAGVDQKFWDLYEGTSGSLAFRSLNDAFSLSNTWLTFNRASGYTIGTISTAAPLTGGTAASSSLILESTSGAGTTDSIVLKTGSQVQAGVFDTTQHFQPGNATAPTIASAACGALTNGAVVAGSNDQAMSITIGAAVTTSCAITFAGTWATAPRACMFTPANATAAAQGTTLAYVSSITATTLTITGAALANANYYIHCY